MVLRRTHKLIFFGNGSLFNITLHNILYDDHYHVPAIFSDSMFLLICFMTPVWEQSQLIFLGYAHKTNAPI